MDLEEKIINTLRSTSSFISGEDLSRELNVSRVAVWKHIENLRHLGYRIEAQHQRGYRFISAPDKLISMEIRHGLKTAVIARDIIAYDEVSSTNDIAMDLAGRGAKEGTVVVAEKQTSGRGRLGRKWFSPARCGLWTSIIFYPEFKPVELCQMNLIMGVALAQAIRKETGLQAELKWPNDIIISKKKVGGILIEMTATMDKVKNLAAGIGINVDISKKDFPSDLRETASSLRLEKGTDIDRLSLFREILYQIEYYYLLAAI
jgi:BirA family biotin operon repressor/biotin-[acetyl-CoA-carboxylase] ligase